MIAAQIPHAAAHNAPELIPTNCRSLIQPRLKRKLETSGPCIVLRLHYSVVYWTIRSLSKTIFIRT